MAAIPQTHTLDGSASRGARLPDLSHSPSCAALHDARGVGLAQAGRIEAARSAFRAALACDPRFARAHFGLAALGGVAPGERAAMERLAADPDGLDAAQRLFLLYALAKAYDEAGDVARAVACAEAGSRLRAARWTGDAEAELRRLADARPPETSERAGDAAEAPIFVFGMPRSGTTLVEQILAAHPHVQALGEGEEFAEAAWRDRWPAEARGRRVVDKSLGNFLRLAAIRRAFPHARLVHVRRDPVDNALSIHFSYFLNDMPFPPTLTGVGRYYRGYAALMAAWRVALPETAMHEIVYERLVADFEGEARRLVAFCGLAWDARCLAFHANAGPVKTASLAQVRRPLYAGSVGRARAYAPHLGPLRAALAGDQEAI